MWVQRGYAIEYILQVVKLGCEASPVRHQRLNNHLILLPSKGTLVIAMCFCCSMTWDKGMRRTRSHKSERPGYWARGFCSPFSIKEASKGSITVGTENGLQAQLSVSLLRSDPESKIIEDLGLLTANGQSQTSLSLDNLSKFQVRQMHSARNCSVKESCLFHTDFLFCFCFLNNTPLLTFWFCKIFLSQVI